MNKTLLITFSFLLVPHIAFSADAVDYNKPFDEIKGQVSDFDQKHSLMPLEIKPISQSVVVNESNAGEYVNVLKPEEKKDEKNSVDTLKIEKDKIEKPEQKVIVKEEVKPVYVVPPAFPEEDKKAMEKAKTDLNDALFIPDVNDVDDDEEDAVNTPKKEDGVQNTKNSVPSSELTASAPAGVAPQVPVVNNVMNNEPFVLKEIPKKKFDGNDIIFSNIIDEKAGSMENHPLVIKKKRKSADVPTDAEPKSLLPETMAGEKQNDISPIKPVTPVMSERNEIVNSLPKIERKVKSVIKPLPQKKVVVENKVQEKVNEDILTAHIASYTTMETANKGIEIWKEKYPLITLLKPSIKYENVEGKGMFYRLYLTGDEAKVENLCNQMKANKDWCNIIR